MFKRLRQKIEQIDRKKFHFRGYRGDILALISGALLPLGFAPFKFFPLVILSLALLFFVWKEIGPWRAFWRGWLYGVGMFGVGVSWIYVSFHDFAYMHAALAVLITVLFIFGMALYSALVGLGLVWLFPECNRVRLLLAAPAFWTLLEWIRSWLLSGFPWLLLGYSQVDYSPLTGFAPLFGVFGVSWATAFTASLLTLALLSDKKTLLKQVLPAFFSLWAIGGLLGFINWTEAQEKTAKVALVQGNISPTIKWLDEEAEKTMAIYLALSQQHRDADLIIWPETAVPIFEQEAGILLAAVEEERLYYHTDFLIGIPVIGETVADKTRYFNGIVSFSDNRSVYHKRHLVPFGEYVPWRSVFGNVLDFLNAPMSDFSSGEIAQPDMKALKQTIGVSICYEIAFPWEIRRSLPAATLLVNVSNDGWFGDSIAPSQHLQIAQMRALENGRYLLRATNTGISAIINEKGKILARSPAFKMDVLRGETRFFQSPTPYSLSGDGPVFFIMLACLGMGFLLHHHWQLHPPRRAA